MFLSTLSNALFGVLSFVNNKKISSITILVIAFVLSLVIFPTRSVFAAELILNPSFEIASGTTATNWTASTWGTSTTTFSIVGGAHTGSNAAQIDVTDYTSGDAKWIFGNIPVSYGQYYVFSDWYKSSTTTQIDILYTTAGGDVFQYVTDLPPVADWTFFTTNIFVDNASSTSMSVVQIISENGTLTTDDYSLVQGVAPVFSQGFVTLTFDDGWKNIYNNGIPILNAKGLKSTQYIYTNAILGIYGSDYMTPLELQAVQNAGHDVEAHTRNHLDLVKENPTNPLSLSHLLGYITQSDMWLGEINGSKSDLLTLPALGLSSTSPVDTFAYPYGSYDTSVKVAVTSAGFLGARSVDEGYNFTNTDKLALKIQHVTATTTPTEVYSWIDKAKTDKTWLILMFHKIASSTAPCVELDGEECISKEMLQGIADYLTNPLSPTTVVTMHQGMSVMNGGAIPDTIAPVFITHADMSLVATSSAGTTVTFTVTATDNVDPSPVVTCSPISDSNFPVGTTTVSCTAIDASHNSVATSFHVGISYNAPIPVIPSVNIIPNTLPDGTVGVSYNQTLTENTTATGPFTWSVSAGVLPGGLSLNGTTAVISGTPNTNGSFAFTIFTTNGTASTTQSYTVNITTAPASTPAPASGGGGGGGGGSPVVTSSTSTKGDVNKDGKINILDFVLLMANWGTIGSGNPADFNLDGRVDILDFVLLMANWTV